MPRYFFDVETSDGALERDATGVASSDIESVLYGCIGEILATVRDGEDIVELVTVKTQTGDVLMTVNVKALRSVVTPGRERT